VKKRGNTFRVKAGTSVFVHQAFRCCPYAAMITSRIHDFLEENGYSVCDEPEEAGAVVVNTCGFNASRSAQAVRTIRLLRKRAPDAPLVVSGCLTRIERGKVRSALKGCRQAAMIGPKELPMFDDIFLRGGPGFGEVRTNLYKDRYSSGDPRMGLFQVLVSTGCMNKCRYCVIRRAKGDVESKPLPEILEEVELGTASGYGDIFLVGDDISCWGMDRGESVGDLVEALVEAGDGCKYSFEAFEPSGFMRHLERLLPSFEKGRITWIVLPVQSGSDRVLERMGRNYTRKQAEEIVESLRSAAPDMIISTDFIFGYPTETMEELEASLEHARIFDYSNFNEYEQRPGTPPSGFSKEEMEPRRRLVKEFLQEQGSQVSVLTRNRVLPYETWTGKDGSAEERKELEKWIAAEADGMRNMLEDGTLGELSGGWRLAAVEESPSGVILVVASGVDKEPMKVLLARRDEGSACMAHSDKFNLCLVSDSEMQGMDEAKRNALGELLRRLGLSEG
jgi:threonylcarbamoyladenosine tRNA methylthiotransferase CDKAL1